MDQKSNAQKSMTALVSAFARAYHEENNEVKIFSDSVAKKLLTAETYDQISNHMAQGIQFFNPDFVGSEGEALKWVVDHQLSPTPLGRAAYTEKALALASVMGAKQYLIFAAGYDTFAYRQPEWGDGLQIFELDHPGTLQDKLVRLKAADIQVPNNVHHLEADFTLKGWGKALTEHVHFNTHQLTFCSLLGLSYYLSKEAFKEMLTTIGEMVPQGSTLIFDYPDEESYTQRAGERAKKQAMMASRAGESMQACYAYAELEALLSDCGFLIYENLTPAEITEQYFKAYNQKNSDHPMTAFDNVNYCLAVKAADRIEQAELGKGRTMSL